MTNLVEEVATQLQARGLRELRAARQLVQAVARELGDLSAERAALERGRADLPPSVPP